MFFEDFEVSEVPNGIFVPANLYVRQNSGTQMLKNILLYTLIFPNSDSRFHI